MQPIDVKPIGAAGFRKHCPCCNAILLFIDNDGDLTPHGSYLDDSDVILLFHDLPPHAQDGFGWQADLAAGECPACKAPLFEITVKMSDAEPDEHTLFYYFWQIELEGNPAHFALRNGKDRWTAARHDTPIGPMAEHSFGPFADTYGDWIGPNGVSSCRGAGPWTSRRCMC